MRSPTSCPFLPGSDRVPAVWAGRALELADARQVVFPRRLAGVYERGRAFLGEYGIGKSVLVNKVADDAARAGHWVTPSVRATLGGDVLALLAEAVSNLVATHDLDRRIGQRATGLLNRVEEIALPVVGGGARIRSPAPDPNPHRAVTKLLVEVARLARDVRSDDLPDGRVVLVRIDEIQNVRSPESLSQLLTTLGDALDATVSEVDAGGIERDRALPLVVYLSGLPDFGREAARAGATFSRRFRTVELEPLEDSDLRDALTPFTSDGWPLLTDEGPDSVLMEPGAVDHVVERCLGDPFLFQLAGEAAWNAGRGRVITTEEAQRGWAAQRREVVRYVEGRLEGLTELQVQYLTTVAGLDADERTAGLIAAAMGRKSSQALGSTAQALEHDHRLIRRRGGHVTIRSRALEAHLAGGWP